MSYALQMEAVGHTTDIAASGNAARALLTGATTPYDVVLLDLQLPDCDGLELLADLPNLPVEMSVIVVTANGSIKRVTNAMRLGAYDFLVKPLASERLITTVRNAVERRALTQEVKIVRKLVTRDSFEGFIGKSPVLQAIYQAIENVAESKATVFITGESGTGKEVAAEAIHRSGRRGKRPFVAINGGAIPENLLESELFGHIKGAFTGAVENRIGAAKEADGGMLVLDEICEMELKLQVKLLRFLQTGMIQRVGSSRPEAVDVRVVCATNRDPAPEVAAGRFREDLFYRLAVIPLEMPALRERGDDVVLLAETFLERFAREEQKRFSPLPPEFHRRLRQRNWPGNVRELQNALRRAVVFNPGPDLAADAIGGDAAAATSATREAAPAISTASVVPGSATEPPVIDIGMFTGMTLDAIERQVIEGTVARCDGSLPAAARLLGISPSTLYRKRERWVSASLGAADSTSEIAAQN